MNTIEGLVRFFNDFNKLLLDGYVHVLGSDKGKGTIALAYKNAGSPKDVSIMGIAGTSLRIMLVKKTKAFFSSSKGIDPANLDDVYSLFIDNEGNIQCSASKNPMLHLNYSLLILVKIFEILGIKRTALVEKGLTLINPTFPIDDFKKEWL